MINHGLQNENDGNSDLVPFYDSFGLIGTLASCFRVAIGHEKIPCCSFYGNGSNHGFRMPKNRGVCEPASVDKIVNDIGDLDALSETKADSKHTEHPPSLDGPSVNDVSKLPKSRVDEVVTTVVVFLLFLS